MELRKEKVCSQCGGKMKREEIDLGYTSGRDLSHPAGAKGRDEFAIGEFCIDCGSLKLTEKPFPCHICGGEPIEGISILERNAKVTGMYEWVPGLPNIINICAGCSPQLDAEIKRLMSEAFEEGGFE